MGDLSALLNQKSPNILSVLDCDNLVQEFRAKNRNLVYFLSSDKIFKELLNLFVNSRENRFLSKIVDLLLNQNTILLHMLAQNPSYLNILSNLLVGASPQSYPKIISLTQILCESFKLWPMEMTVVISADEIDIIPYLVKCIDKMPIFNFMALHLTKSTEHEFVMWYVFLCLMDEHGPGATTPMQVTRTFDTYDRLNPVQRNKAIKLLTIYTKEHPDETDFLSALSQALPLLLSDASDDAERTLIFKLGCTLEINISLVKSATSVLGAFKGTTPLVVSALKYLDSFKVKLSQDIIICFMYRFLKMRTHSSVLMNPFLGVLKNSVENDPELINDLRQMVAWAFSLNKNNVSMLMRTFRVITQLTLDGTDFDSCNADFVEIFKEQAKKTDSFENASIQRIRTTIKSVHVQENPTFDARTLWGESADTIGRRFHTIDRLEHLSHRRSPTKTRSKSPQVTSDHQELSPRYRDDSEVKTKIKMIPLYPLAENDFNPRPKVDVRRKEERPPRLVPQLLLNSRRRQDFVDTEDASETDRKQSVKAPQTPPTQPAPHRLAAYSPGSANAPKRRIVNESIDIVSTRPALKLCSLDALEFTVRTESVGAQADFEVPLEDAGVNPERKPPLTIDNYLDPIALAEKRPDAMPQLQRCADGGIKQRSTVLMTIKMNKNKKAAFDENPPESGPMSMPPPPISNPQLGSPSINPGYPRSPTQRMFQSIDAKQKRDDKYSLTIPGTNASKTDRPRDRPAVLMKPVSHTSTVV